MIGAWLQAFRGDARLPTLLGWGRGWVLGGWQLHLWEGVLVVALLGWWRYSTGGAADSARRTASIEKATSAASVDQLLTEMRRMS